MDGQAAARSIKEMLAYLAAIKAGGNLKDDEWLKTCLKHQVILEQQIAGCTGITLSQASEVITALVQAEAPDSFKSVSFGQGSAQQDFWQYSRPGHSKAAMHTFGSFLYETAMG